jgi:hypothetical protein
LVLSDVDEPLIAVNGEKSEKININLISNAGSEKVFVLDEKVNPEQVVINQHGNK